MHSDAADRTYFFIRFNAKTLYHLVNISLRLCKIKLSLQKNK